MSDLLPIIFARGQNEGIDPRVAPPDVHVIAQNVRWRKDGRPAKRYGLTQISSTGIDSGGSLYGTTPINAITSWLGSPVMVLGGGVRQFLNGKWTSASDSLAREISHWGPGRRDAVARTDLAALENASVGQSNGYLVYAWDDGTNVFYQVRLVSGGVVTPKVTLAAGDYVRCVGLGNFVYILYRQGAAVLCAAFDTTTLSVSATSNPGTLNSASCFFDAIPRSTDWLLVNQSTANALTIASYTNTASPTAIAVQSVTMTAAQVAKVAIAGTGSSSVFVAWVEAASGKVQCTVYDNALAVQQVVSTNLNTQATNVDQPGIVINNASGASIFWGGYSSPNSYLQTKGFTNGGAASSLVTLFFCRAASKPFLAPAHGLLLDNYIWVHTHNSDATNSNKGWDDQRTFYLMRIQANVGGANLTFVRQMHTPNMVGSTGAFTSHLSDVVSLGSGLGYVTALQNTLRFGNAAAVEDYGIDSVTFSSIFDRQRSAARDTRTVGRALQIAGGALYEYTGATEETGFSNFPVILSATSSAGGGLTPSSTYLYVAVVEWLDTQGRRHRSSPSDPFTGTTTGANFTIQLSIETLIAQARLGTCTIHVYRTLAGGTTFHRVTPNEGAPSAFTAGVGTVTYTDSMSDANAAANEFVYTDGGVVPNDLAPPCTFMALVNGRLWLGGQLDRNVITASKILVDGEPTQFSSEAEFSAFLPEDCTGLAGLDGTVVAFAREAIYLVNGDGPNDQGIGSFNPPQKLPTDTGCIDWRSVLETSLGVFYQSKRGFFLLPRGFNTPIFIGAEVEDTVTNFPICLSATLVSVPSSPGKLGEITARFVMANAETATNSVVLVYDLRAQGWSVDVTPDLAHLGPGGTWSDTWIQSKTAGGVFASLWAESNAGYGDNGAFIGTVLGTGDIRPFGVAGYGGFDSVVVVGEFRGSAFVNVSVSVDGATPDFFSFNVASADAPDGSVYLDVTPKVRLGSSLSVQVSDTSGSPSEGFIAQALFIEHETIGKTKRLAAARKA